MNRPHTLAMTERMDFRSPVFVIGAGGHGKVVVQLLRELGARVGGVVDDDPAAEPPNEMNFLGPIMQLSRYERPQAVIAIGDNTIRRRVREELDAHWLTLVHPTSYVAPSAKLGRGVVVCANAVVCEDVQVGEHTIINTSASVDHDVVVGEFTHLACGVTLAGGVSVGDDVLIGAGATVLPSVSVGDRSVLGAGSVATKDIADEKVAYGVPARFVRDC